MVTHRVLICGLFTHNLLTDLLTDHGKVNTERVPNRLFKSTKVSRNTVDENCKNKM